MKERFRAKRTSKYLVLMIVFLLAVNVTLGYFLMRQSTTSIIDLMQTRMLDISNTAAAMIDGDVLETVTPADAGTEGYESIMRTLLYFQDNIDLKYIYCIRDKGDGTFVFGLDPSDDPGEFGSPVVYTDALFKASQGTPAADRECYQDAWGSFYSAYTPVFNSKHEVAGIIGVDFSAEWYNRQLATLTRTTVIVAVLSLLVGGGIVYVIIARNRKKIGALQGQLNELSSTLMHEMGKDSAEESRETAERKNRSGGGSIDDLEKQIHSMQAELKSQIAQMHGQAYTDGLTGVKSRQAFLETEKSLNEKLSRGPLPEFAIAVCDVNGLKKINDTQGHKAGDEYICKACKMICDIFAHSPVYRVGGDEFVVMLSGKDYENRKVLMHELHRRSSAHITTQEAIVSGGMAEYNPEEDHRIQEVFDRADAAMYTEKTLLKSLGAVTRESEADAAQREAEMQAFPIRMRKHLLIADDVEQNREILGSLLEDDYDIYYAGDGAETMAVLREHKDQIALVLLDLYMPNGSGRDVIKQMRVDEDLMTIPVIVVTVDQEAELDCLKIGATDFIPKPYPDIEIMKARISICIEHSENLDLIRSTQRDKLTGLYNIDYFYQYVNRYDKQDGGAGYDAVVCDVNRFYEVNEQYGRYFGDLVLRSIGNSFRKLARKTGGIGCRKGGDTFMLYCPHREDYEALIRRFLEDLFVEKETGSKVSLRFGVYAYADREENIEERFEKAADAADSIKGREEIIGYAE